MVCYFIIIHIIVNIFIIIIYLIAINVINDQ